MGNLDAEGNAFSAEITFCHSGTSFYIETVNSVILSNIKYKCKWLPKKNCGFALIIIYFLKKAAKPEKSVKILIAEGIRLVKCGNFFYNK